MRCGVYVRVSTDDQRDNGYSIDSQLRMIKEYWENNYYDIVDVYNDVGHSGKDLMKEYFYADGIINCPYIEGNNIVDTLLLIPKTEIINI